MLSTSIAPGRSNRTYRLRSHPARTVFFSPSNQFSCPLIRLFPSSPVQALLILGSRTSRLRISTVRLGSHLDRRGLKVPMPLHI